MIKSDLATMVVDFGNNKSNPRNAKIIGITPHHMAGKMLADDCAKSHLYSDRQSSAQYYIGYDGGICAGVSEDRRAWTSSSRPNDHSHITIEVSNDGGEPNWHISDAAYKSLVNLCADICRRYDIDPHFTGEAGASITYHQMFAATDCPGPYLKNLIDSGKFEEDIKIAMGKEPKPQPVKTLYRVQTGAFRDVNGARDLEARLKDDEFDTYIVIVGELYKVQCGAFSSKKNAEKLAKELTDAGYETFITTNANDSAIKEGTDKVDPVEKLGYWIGEQYTVLVNRLNVRSGPSMKNAVIGVVRIEEKVTVLDAQKIGSEVWIKIGDNRWICAIGEYRYVG